LAAALEDLADLHLPGPRLGHVAKVPHGLLPGAVLGGLVLGWTESFATGYVSSDYEDVFAFCLLVLILIFRPAGLLGRSTVQKV